MIRGVITGVPLLLELKALDCEAPDSILRHFRHTLEAEG